MAQTLSLLEYQSDCEIVTHYEDGYCCLQARSSNKINQIKQQLHLFLVHFLDSQISRFYYDLVSLLNGALLELPRFHTIQLNDLLLPRSPADSIQFNEKYFFCGGYTIMMTYYVLVYEVLLYCLHAG